MRLLRTLYKNARQPQDEKKVPFVEILPLKLRNFVSEKKDKAAQVACLQEMALLFACMKKNDFVETPCVKEISSLNACYEAFLANKAAAELAYKRGDPKPGRNLNSKQLNQFLKQWPNPR